ncbi:MAG: O-antigen ligase family protein [Eubacteriales bacterium]
MFWNIGVTARNETRLFVLVTVLLSAILLPSFSLHPNLPNVRLDEILLFGLFGLNMLVLLIHRFKFNPEEKEQLRKQKKPLKLVCILFSFLLFSYVISNIYGVFFKAGSYTLRDVMELVTYFKYFLIITLAISVELGEEEFSFLSKAFLTAVFLLMLFGWGQHLNLFNMNTWFSPYFNQVHWELMIVGNPARVLGTFDNPNVFGTFTVITLAILVVRYYFSNSTGKFPILIFVLIGLVLKLEYLTISRTSLFGIALAFTISSIWALIYYKREKKVIIKIVALFLLTLILFLTASSGFLNRVYEGLDFSTSTSFQGHVERWETAAGSIRDSLVFGWGTQKSTMTTMVDNEYALYTRRYGLIGLSVYLWFFLQPFVLAVRKISFRVKNSYATIFDNNSLLAAAFIVLLPSILVYNFLAGIFYNLQLMTILSVLIGLVYNLEREEY